MRREKLIIGLLALGVLMIIAVPVESKFGDRPHMTHSQWKSFAGDIGERLPDYGEQQWRMGSEMVEVNLDELTGLNGYNLLGGEVLFGSRSLSVLGKLPKDQANHFFVNEEGVWLGVDDLNKLWEIISSSEQDVVANPQSF